MMLLFVILAIASAIYGILLSMQTNIFASQNWIWFVIAFFFFVFAIILHINKKRANLLPLVVGMYTILIAVVLAFVITEVIIVNGSRGGEVANLDYIIVLGSGIKDEGEPGQSLKLRLDKAIEYLENNERTKAVLSGGRGADEPCEEALVMGNYMTKRGINPDRLLLELQSKDTSENIIYSMALIEDQKERRLKTNPKLALAPGPALPAERKPSTIGILTNDFHLYRALQRAKKEGVEGAYGIAAKTPPFLIAHLYVREFFAVIRDKLYGDI